MTIASIISAVQAGGGGSSTSGRRVVMPLVELTQSHVDAAVVHLLNPNQAKSEATMEIFIGGTLLTLGVGCDARFDIVSGDLSWDQGSLLYRAQAGMAIQFSYEVP